MLLKIYNKLGSYREVGVPEAISHMLDYPDHYTDGHFANLNTNHLQNYIKYMQLILPLHEPEPASVENVDVEPDFEIIVEVNTDNGRRYDLVPVFDDYVHHGDSLANYCLYDYRTLMYKDRKAGGIPFDSRHQQYKTHTQLVRGSTVAIPTLLGRLLFLHKRQKRTRIEKVITV